MEGVKHESRHQKNTNFYQKNYITGKACTINFFKALNVKNDQVYQAIIQVEAGRSHEQQIGTVWLRKLSKYQEKDVVKAMENKIGSSLQVSSRKLGISKETIKCSLNRQGVD